MADADSRRFTMGILAASLGLGLAIGYVDSRPTWDDAGITAGALLLVAGGFSLMRPRQWWMVALLVGLPTPLFGYAMHGTFGASLALVVTAVAAGAGAAIGWAAGFAEASGRRGE